ncbi:MAG: cation diffusion facilitator family transporter [Dehalococcoidia bacterium]
MTISRTNQVLRDTLHCHVPQGDDASHDHDHSAGHRHSEGASGRRLALALGISAIFFGVQLVGGFWTGSLALLADSAHLLGDAVALALALGAAWLARRPASLQRTFGYRRAEVLAALINGGTLVVAAVWIGMEAFERIQAPRAVEAGPMLVIAIAGLAANAISLRILGHGHGINERGAFLHVLGDLLGSVAVIVAGVLMALFGWWLADPILSVLIAGLVCLSAIRLLKEALDVLMLAAPGDRSVQVIAQRMNEAPGVIAVHDLHLWTVTSGFESLSAHVLVDDSAEPCLVLEQLTALLHDEFSIEHTTLQVEHDQSTGAIHPDCAPSVEIAPTAAYDASRP